MSHKVIERITVDELVEIIRASGYHATVEEKDGRREVRFGSNGKNCHIHYDAKELETHKGFSSFRIYSFANFDKLLDGYDLNLYNAKTRNGRCYTTEKGGVTYETCVSLRGGVTSDHISHLLKTWDAEFGGCLQFIAIAERKAKELKDKMATIMKSKEQGEEPKA